MAYKAARSRADAYAAAAGLEVDRVLTIRDGGEGGRLPAAADGRGDDRVRQWPPPSRAPPPPPFSPGMNRTQVSVTVAFALAGK